MYGTGFDDVLKGAGVEAIHTPLQAPNANAFAERWVRSLRQECLNHLVIFGLNRLQHVLDEYVRFFNEHRPHQGIANCIPKQFENAGNSLEPDADETWPHSGGVRCQRFLGGLLKSYHPQAA